MFSILNNFRFLFVIEYLHTFMDLQTSPIFDNILATVDLTEVFHSGNHLNLR